MFGLNRQNSLIRAYLTEKPIFDQPPEVAIFQEKPLPVLKELKVELSEMESLFGKWAPNLIIDPPIVLLWKNRAELPFLEKVATAITQSVETAECREFDQKYFNTAKVIVAEASLLQIDPHQLQKNPIRLGMYKTSEYMKNVELKRDLWKLLQNIGDLLV